MAVNVIDDNLTGRPRARHTDAIDNLRLSVRLSARVLVFVSQYHSLTHSLSLYLSPPRRGATTAEKLRGTKVWVPTPGCVPTSGRTPVHPGVGTPHLSRTQYPPRPKAGVGVGCGRRSPPPAVRVREYDPRKIFENSDDKSCILVTTCCEISCFLKTTAKKLGDQYIVGDST